MLVLGIDTSFYHLCLALIKDDQLLATCFEYCQRNQSELLVNRINDLLLSNKLSSEDIKALVVTIGPGSYTGVRIALTFAKVFSVTKNIPLYSLSTLQLYAGLDDKIVVFDARAKRCYLGVYNEGSALLNDKIVSIEEALKIKALYPDYLCYGEGSLLGEEENLSDISSNFFALKNKWKIVENIHLLKPNYLKEEEAYGNN